MIASHSRLLVLTLLTAPLLLSGGEPPAPTERRVATVAELVAAVQEAAEGSVIDIAPGTYELSETLELKAGMTLRGAGLEQTILSHVPQWRPDTKSLPDPEMKLQGLDTQAYLLRLPRDTAGVTISHLTLRAPQLHGALFAWFPRDLQVYRVRVQDTLWSGIRTFGMQRARIHECEFIDAGGRWEKGKPGQKGGITGGGIFAIWMSDTEIAHNRFTRTQLEPADEFYGIKVRQAKECRVHHNTIETNFSMEFPFENDADNELDHNVCHGTISLPKHAGGNVPPSGRTFHIHHNWFRDSYSIEFVRNGIEIDHNLFDCDLTRDHGNLISGFGQAAAPGPALFHNNLVRNPGRGVVWINEVFNHFEIRNNHIVTQTTTTPRREGLFGFNSNCDFSTIVIRDNRIECEGIARPLLRAKASYAARVENNQLVNVADAELLTNTAANRPIGLEQPLRFACGVQGEITVDGWTASPTKP